MEAHSRIVCTAPEHQGMEYKCSHQDRRQLKLCWGTSSLMRHVSAVFACVPIKLSSRLSATNVLNLKIMHDIRQESPGDVRI